jgi:hypothetical protein
MPESCLHSPNGAVRKILLSLYLSNLTQQNQQNQQIERLVVTAAKHQPNKTKQDKTRLGSHQ